MKGIRCSINIHEIDVRFLFTYLFIYLFINFAKRPGSPTEQAALRGPEKKNILIQLTRMTYFRNDKKRNGNAKTELGTTSIKNQQHIRSSKLFNGRLVWHLIHTLLKVWGVSTSVINRLNEIQVVNKKILLAKCATDQSVFRRWAGKVFQILEALQ